MLSNTIKRNLFILPLTALFISNVAFAHDVMKSVALEGHTDDNAIKINHGCEESGKPIIAQSVVFPGQDAVLTTSDRRTIASLADVIEGGIFPINLIQDKNIFAVQKQKYDALNNVSGFYGKTGALDVALKGRLPFEFTAPSFVSTSCVKTVFLQVAVADICVLTRPTIDANKVNLWIPDNGSQYAKSGQAAGVDGVGEPVTLRVNRNLAANKLPTTCGKGIELTVTPSAADIDAHLGIPGYWSK